MQLNFIFNNVSIFREILLEEKLSDSETMKRENRRIAAMSWGGNDSDEPPPKPSRTPLADSTFKQLMDGEKTDINTTAMTYIVAENPTVLAKLMKENELRGVNASSYTTPASVFNVLAVEFDQTTENKPTDEIPLKTSKIPAMELIPLQQDKTADIFQKCHPSSFPSNPHISGNETSTSPGLPPQPPDSKSKSLERNLSQAPFGRICSLERRQQQLADLNMKGNRSQSLIRQYNVGIHQADDSMIRSTSLERNQQFPPNFKPTGTSHTNPPPPPPYVRHTTMPAKGGSLERSQAVVMNDLMRKYYDQKAMSDAQKPRSGGSLERNFQYQQYLMSQKQQLQAQLQSQQQNQEELIEAENIYDFGGEFVKSCATIALKKSIERGMLPPGFDPNFSSGPPSLENRNTMQPSVKQPGPGIASRIMIFQGSQTMKPLPPQANTNPPKFISNPNYYTLPNQTEAKEVRKKLLNSFTWFELFCCNFFPSVCAFIFSSLKFSYKF